MAGACLAPCLHFKPKTQTSFSKSTSNTFTSQKRRLLYLPNLLERKRLTKPHSKQSSSQETLADTTLLICSHNFLLGWSFSCQSTHQGYQEELQWACSCQETLQTEHKHWAVLGIGEASSFSSTRFLGLFSRESQPATEVDPTPQFPASDQGGLSPVLLSPASCSFSKGEMKILVYFSAKVTIIFSSLRTQHKTNVPDHMASL